MKDYGMVLRWLNTSVEIEKTDAPKGTVRRREVYYVSFELVKSEVI